MKRDPSALEDVRDVQQLMSVILASPLGITSLDAVAADRNVVERARLRLNDAARKLQATGEKEHLTDLAVERGDSPLSRALLDSADRIEEAARILNRRSTPCGACGSHLQADRKQFQVAVMIDAMVLKMRGLASTPVIAAAERETADAHT